MATHQSYKSVTLGFSAAGHAHVPQDGWLCRVKWGPFLSGKSTYSLWKTCKSNKTTVLFNNLYTHSSSRITKFLLESTQLSTHAVRDPW